MHKDWKDTDGTVASVEEYQTRSGKQYSVVFTYKVDGEWYGGTFTTTDSYSKGDAIPVLYDPLKPDRNNLVQRETIRHWVVGAVLCALGLVFLFAALR
jgi:hypothetical protein